MDYPTIKQILVEKISKIKKRMLEVAKNKKISYEKFFKEFGTTYDNFKGKSLKSSLRSSVLVDFSSKHPDVDLHWLITGQVKTPTNAVHESSNTPDFKAKYLDVVENYMILNNENSELRQELKTLKKQLLIKNE